MLAAVLAAIILLLAGIWLGGHPGSLPSPLRGRLLESNRQNVTQQALSILATRFYRPIDRSSLVDQGLSAMVAGLDDPYSHYLDPRAYRERNAPATREIGGIGITTTPEATGLRVVSVLDGSPAAGAGLIPSDLIIKVGSTSLADQPENVGPDLIRGPPGTKVELTLLRGDKQHVISIERANIVVPVASWKMLAYQKLRIGYLRLTGFPEDAGDKLRAEVRAALDEHAQALILDLRGNGGGLIGEAVNVASAFLTHGKILSAVERGRPQRTYMAEGNAIAPRIPLVVLVDHGTASSAEIVTAALQDDGRAKVVGTRTYGKGTFQQTQSLMNGGALDITIGRFYTPDGRNLGSGGQRDGITPNVEAENNPRTADDEALAAAERTVAAQVH